ncbi:MAG: P-II family nitrogen regulator [Tissierellia bacterium]|nr:P-II family nitrogen regulator [Tissierellia bacterium]
MKNYSLFVAVVAKGRASKVVELAKGNGAGGATIFYGTGTAKNHLLHLLEMDEMKKEIVFVLIPNSIDRIIHRQMVEELEINRENAGICFTVPVHTIFGLEMEKEMEQMITKYTAIMTIVDRGIGDKVIEIAEQQGSKGGTILHGRGSGIEKKRSFFNITIEPEKEMVFMLVGKDQVEKITKALVDKLEISKPGKGIVFTLPVTNATGLVE